MISRCMESTELLTGAIDCTLIPWLCTGRPFVFASVLLFCRRVFLVQECLIDWNTISFPGVIPVQFAEKSCYVLFTSVG